MGRLNITVADEFIKDMDGYLERQNCKSRSEFLEKALKFYLGYNETSKHSEYLNQSVAEGVRQGLNDIERQTMPNLFRLSVEISMLTNLLASGVDLPKSELRRLRADCVKAVRATNKRANLDHAVNYQNTGEDSHDFYEEFTGPLDWEA